jgi:proteasome lid subunit RPN8/RPN11
LGELQLTGMQYQQIVQHAMATYPQECCGLLVGQGKQTIVVYPMENVSSSPHDRYTIDPAAMLAVMKSVRGQDLSIIGIYHSHPDHPAVPSERDRELAWPEYSYLILSVSFGQVVDRQSWCLHEAGVFRSERIQVI